MGLVNEVVLPENLRTRVEEIALSMSELPPIALQMTKKSLEHAYGNDLRSHLELVSSYQGITQRSSDHFKAIDGLIEKKKQIFDHR